LGRVVPHVGIALPDVNLVQREGDPCDVPAGATLEPVEQVLGGVAGEGTAVVPRDGERIGAHRTVNPCPGPRIPKRRTRPVPAPAAAGTGAAPSGPWRRRGRPRR